MNSLTDNKNLLATNRFKIVVNSSLANFTFFAVTANIPSISVPPTPANYRNNKGYVNGDTMEFDAFNVRMAINEDFDSYHEIYNWMRKFVEEPGVHPKDMSLFILNSANNPNQEFKFINAFPTSLGAIEFNAQVSDIEYAYADVTFHYDYFIPVTKGSGAFDC